MRISLPNSTEFAKVFESALGKTLEVEASGVATDSREVQKGDMYIAIPGKRVDGHSFLTEVFEKGAVSALVNHVNTNIDGKQILVDDPVKAIGKVSTVWRSQFDIPVIGITGSNVKTTTKELIYNILSIKKSC